MSRFDHRYSCKGRPTLEDQRLIDLIDHTEAAARQQASEVMLELLMREHPERATVSHPHGTKAPRRMPMPPTSGGSVQSIDFEG